MPKYLRKWSAYADVTKGIRDKCAIFLNEVNAVKTHFAKKQKVKKEPPE